MAQLCTVVLIFGLLRCLLTGTALEKHFSLIWGILLLSMMVNCFSGCEFSEEITFEDDISTVSGYDELVTKKAAIILEKSINQVIYSKYGIECSAVVNLNYRDETITIERVTVNGTFETGYLKQFLCDYLMVGEDVIDFA